jgi:hypothetical protein
MMLAADVIGPARFWSRGIHSLDVRSNARIIHLNPLHGFFQVPVPVSMNDLLNERIIDVSIIRNSEDVIIDAAPRLHIQRDAQRR